MDRTEIDTLSRDALDGRLSRREVLRRAGALGLSAPVIAALLAACGGGGDDDATSTTSSSSGGEATGSTGGATLSTSGTPGGSEEGEASGPRGGGGELRLLYWQAATILNPHLSQGTKDWHAARIALEPLAEFTSDGKMIPVLAAEEPTRDNGMVAEDGKSVTWKLLEGVKWHDGQPFTAQDVKFTYEWVSDKATSATSYGSYETIESVETPDDLTVVVHFKEPQPDWTKPFTGELGMILPAHALKDYTGENARSAPFNLKPIGTGPFKVVDFRPGDEVSYEINNDYREPGKPHFDRVLLKGGGDATSAARAVLQSGEADWAWNLQVEANVLTSLEKAGNGKLVIWPGSGTEVLVLNHSDPETEQDGQRSNKNVPHPHFKEKQVRQAIASAIQRDVIAETLYGPGGDVTASTITSPTNLVPTDINWQFDLDKAGQLLDAAGAKPGSNGIRELNGRPMKWLYQTTVNSVRQKIQELVKNSLKQIGLDAQLKTIDSSVFFSADPGNSDTVSHFYADLEMYNTGPKNIFPSAWYRRYLSTAIPQKENGWAEANYSRYQNPDLDKLFDQVINELDPKKAEELFLQMQRLVWAEVAEIGLVAVNNVSAANAKLTGYEPSSWRPQVADIANWRKE